MWQRCRPYELYSNTPSHRTFDYVPLTVVGEGYEFVLTSKTKVRMDSTSTGNQFLILRDIPSSQHVLYDQQQ